MSPYSVAYPTAISDLLPVATTMPPNLFDNAIRMAPRIRAWRFSSATFGSVSANGVASASRNPLKMSSIAISSNRQPRLRASSSESFTDPVEE